MKIKRVVRRYLPETNSSSSHSLVIATGSDRYKNLRGRTLDIDVNYFGHDSEFLNDIVSKIEFALGSFAYLDMDNYLEKVKKIQDIIEKEYHSSLNFKFLQNYFENLIKDKEGDVYMDEYFPMIDHQSAGLGNEIWENEDTLRNFLVNPRSELYLDSDSSSGGGIDFNINSKFEDFDIILRYPLGGKIGDVDILIPNLHFKSNRTMSVLLKEMSDVFSAIYWKDGEFVSYQKGLTSDYLSYRENWGKDYWIAEWRQNSLKYAACEPITVTPSIISKEFGNLCI